MKIESSLNECTSSLHDLSIDEASAMNESVCEPDCVHESDCITPIILPIDGGEDSMRNKKDLSVKKQSEAFLEKKSERKKKDGLNVNIPCLNNKNIVQAAFYRDNYGFGTSQHLHSSCDTWGEFRQSDSVTRGGFEDVHVKPVLTIVATPVPEETGSNSVEREVQKTLCFQKIILMTIIILVFVVGLASYLAYKQGIFLHSSIAPTSLSSVLSLPSSFPTLKSTEASSDQHSPESTPPSTFPTSFRDSILFTSRPSISFTDLPSFSVISQPSLELSASVSPTSMPTKGCMIWCADHSTPWTDPDPNVNQKCRWPVNCGGCPECDPISSPSLNPISNCLPWCESHSAPWRDRDPEVNQKCKWANTCSECPQCHGEDVNLGQ